jgi:hypothetical protein
VKRFASAVVALVGVVVLASCGFNPVSWLPRDYPGVAADRMVEIVDAVNNQDAAALKGMFTEYALNEYSDEIDEGLEYLLSLFPDGDLVWEDPEYQSPVSESFADRKRMIMVPALYDVSAGGKDYWLFFSFYIVNDIDPANIGIYGMGAAPRTETKSSGPEGVFFSWAGSISRHRDNDPAGVYMPDYDNGELSDRMMDLIVEDDLNIQDRSGLGQKFTEHAQAQYPEQLGDEVDELFALFPDGDIVWEPLTEDPDVRVAADGDNETILLLPIYRVSSGGKDYWLFFADFTVNTIDPDNLGLYAIGVAARTETGDSPQEEALFAWADTFDVDATTPPGILISQ